MTVPPKATADVPAQAATSDVRLALPWSGAGIATPIALVRAALQQTFPFELIDVGDHPARQRSDAPGKRALTHTWRTGQDFEGACVRGSEL